MGAVQFDRVEADALRAPRGVDEIALDLRESCGVEHRGQRLVRVQ